MFEPFPKMKPIHTIFVHKKEEHVFHAVHREAILSKLFYWTSFGYFLYFLPPIILSRQKWLVSNIIWLSHLVG